MPYIKEQDREKFNAHIEKLVANLQTAGELNYVISTMLNKIVMKHGASYTLFNELVGVLECAKMELYRRAIVKYENKKILDNGDVYE